MPQNLIQEIDQAIKAEKDLVGSYQKMLKISPNTKIKTIIHDLIIMEEMNEVLLRSLNQHLN